MALRIRLRHGGEVSIGYHPEERDKPEQGRVVSLIAQHAPQFTAVGLTEDEARNLAESILDALDGTSHG